MRKAIPDTSVIIESLISKQIKNKKFNFDKVIIHEAVLAELESQANKNKETGILGLEEIERIRLLSKNKVEFKGNRPGDFEIKFAKSGEIDSLIRDLAYKENGTLITADVVQSKVAKAKGIKVILFKFPTQKSKKLLVEKYFDKNTYSVHIKENCPVFARKGILGLIKYKKLSKKTLSKDAVQNLSKDIVESVKMDSSAFIESDRKTNTVLRINDFRIAIIRPPLSNGYEIVIQKILKKPHFANYKISSKLTSALFRSKNSVLVIGLHDSGKSSFVRSYAKKLSEQNKKVVFTGNQRVSILNNFSHYSICPELMEILSLVKPDKVIIDEIVNGDEYKLFNDLSSSGVCVVGLMSSDSVLNAIEKFTKKSDSKIISNFVDLIILMNKGNIDKYYKVKKTVKGFVISDFNSEKIILEHND